MATNFDMSLPLIYQKVAGRRAADYPLVVRIRERHLLITCPDLPLSPSGGPLTVPFNPPNKEDAYRAIQGAYLQIFEHLRAREARGQEGPKPSSKDEAYPEIGDEVGMAEACQILRMKRDMVRELADRGELPCRMTPGGHRRFALSGLEAFRRGQFPDRGNASAPNAG